MSEKIEVKKVIELCNSGTLLFGLTTERNFLHVYVKSGKLNSLLYKSNGEVIRHIVAEDEIFAHLCKPSKFAFKGFTQIFFEELMKRKKERVTLELWTREKVEFDKNGYALDAKTL